MKPLNKGIHVGVYIMVIQGHEKYVCDEIKERSKEKVMCMCIKLLLMEGRTLTTYNAGPQSCGTDFNEL